MPSFSEVVIPLMEAHPLSFSFENPTHSAALLSPPPGFQILLARYTYWIFSFRCSTKKEEKKNWIGINNGGKYSFLLKCLFSGWAEAYTACEYEMILLKAHQSKWRLRTGSNERGMSGRKTLFFSFSFFSELFAEQFEKDWMARN